MMPTVLLTLPLMPLVAKAVVRLETIEPKKKSGGSTSLLLLVLFFVVIMRANTKTKYKIN